MRPPFLLRAYYTALGVPKIGLPDNGETNCIPCFAKRRAIRSYPPLFVY